MRLPPFAVLLFLPLLAACQSQMTTAVAISDIVAVGDSGHMRTVAATLRVPQQDYAHCIQALDGIAKAFAVIMPVGATQCTDIDASTTFADIETQLALVPASGAEQPLPGILTLEVNLSDEGGAPHYALTLTVLRTLDELSRLAMGTKEPLGDPLPYELIPRISIAIENDIAQDTLIEYGDLFVDGRPYLAPDEADEVPPGQTRQLQLSDVASARIATGHSYPIATIWPVQR